MSMEASFCQIWPQIKFWTKLLVTVAIAGTRFAIHQSEKTMNNLENLF